MNQTIVQVLQTVAAQTPLVHYITNPISMRDSANALLAVGASPIMAQHPREVEEITRGAAALALNLGNISDSRMQAMALSAQTAQKHRIPATLDLVGVACSSLRLDFAQKLVAQSPPQIIKGNRSEWEAFAQNKTTAKGVDVSPESLSVNETQFAGQLARQAARLGCVAAATGPADLIAAPDGRVYVLRGGHPLLGKVTGTGCILTGLMAACCAGGDPLAGALAACCAENAAGEQAAAESSGPGSFLPRFIDALYRQSQHPAPHLYTIERMEPQ